MQKMQILFKKIAEGTDYSEEEIENMVKEKEVEFSGLISTEGAAHIVAKELGVNVLERKEVKLADVVPDLQSVSVVGKIVKKFEPKEFVKGDKKGAVANIIIGDETGTIRMSLWDEQIKFLDELEEGDVVKIFNGYTKEDFKGGAELRVGSRGLIKKSEEKIENVKTTTTQQERSYSRSELKALTVGDNAEVRAAVVQVFENNPFFMKKGEETPEPRLVLNGIIDDGTANMRLVGFAEAVEQLIGDKTSELLKISNNGINPKPVLEKYNNILGKEYLFRGYVKLNNFFERPEFVINSVEEVDPKKEAKLIMDIMEK